MSLISCDYERFECDMLFDDNADDLFEHLYLVNSSASVDDYCKEYCNNHANCSGLLLSPDPSSPLSIDHDADSSSDLDQLLVQCRMIHGNMKRKMDKNGKSASGLRGARKDERASYYWEDTRDHDTRNDDAIMNRECLVKLPDSCHYPSPSQNPPARHPSLRVSTTTTTSRRLEHCGFACGFGYVIVIVAALPLVIIAVCLAAYFVAGVLVLVYWICFGILYVICYPFILLYDYCIGNNSNNNNHHSGADGNMEEDDKTVEMSVDGSLPDEQQQPHPAPNVGDVYNEQEVVVEENERQPPPREQCHPAPNVCDVNDEQEVVVEEDEDAAAAVAEVLGVNVKSATLYSRGMKLNSSTQV